MKIERCGINNAGIIAGPGRLQGSLDGARREMEVNYLGAWAMSRAFAPILAANGGALCSDLPSFVTQIANDTRLLKNGIFAIPRIILLGCAGLGVGNRPEPDMRRRDATAINSYGFFEGTRYCWCLRSWQSWGRAAGDDAVAASSPAGNSLCSETTW